MTKHGLSFDIEDWHQLSAMRIGRPTPDASEDVERCVARILDVCDEAQVKATFFVVGLLARRRPQLVREIAARGHEVASHSDQHRLIHQMPLTELAEDLRTSKQMLEDLAGTEVVGFRAPEFSVQRLDHPCFTVLREQGFEYDSSVFPIPGLRYGIENAPRVPFSFDTPAGRLVELPLATTSIAGRQLPIAGGSGWRLLPTRFLTWAADRAEARGETLIFYFHPYEFTKRLVYLSGGLKPNLKIAKHVVLHNFATYRIARSLRRILSRLQFEPLRTLAAARRELEHRA
ncbi:MAG: DUF3473 domain-containing protein [Deltaproteobacteria bacterium]|nr:DUF3473 domain-containing protein [Deltaproteobacteria bacterium]